MCDNDVVFGLVIEACLDSQAFVIARKEPDHATPFNSLSVTKDRRCLRRYDSRWKANAPTEWLK
jgi:hypothetical protein